MYVYVFASKDKADSFTWEPKSIKEMKMASVYVDDKMTIEQHQAILADIMQQLFQSEVIGMPLKEAESKPKEIKKPK